MGSLELLILFGTDSLFFCRVSFFFLFVPSVQCGTHVMDEYAITFAAENLSKLDVHKKSVKVFVYLN